MDKEQLIKQITVEANRICPFLQSTCIRHSCAFYRTIHFRSRSGWDFWVEGCVFLAQALLQMAQGKVFWEELSQARSVLTIESAARGWLDSYTEILNERGLQELLSQIRQNNQKFEG